MARGPVVQFYAMVALLYLTIAYSTSLQFVYGPERTIDCTYYTYSRDHALRQYYPDIGAWQAGRKVGQFGAWKLTSFWGDAGYYLLQVKDPALSISPYRYRILPSTLVRTLHHLIGVDPVVQFAVVNLATGVCTALLLTFYLRSCLGFSQLASTLGALLFLTSVPVTRTLPFPMLDMVACLWTMIMVIAVFRRKLALFLLAAVLGVATKEALLAVVLLWPLNMLDRQSLSLRSSTLWKSLVALIVPLLTFSLIRKLAGGSALEVNYGFDPLHGQFPEYWRRMVSAGGIARLTFCTVAAYGFVWWGLRNVGYCRLFRRSFWVVPVLLLMTYVLSGQVARVLGPLFPILIPMFLVLFEKPAPDLGIPGTGPSAVGREGSAGCQF